MVSWAPTAGLQQACTQAVVALACWKLPACLGEDVLDQALHGSMVVEVSANLAIADVIIVLSNVSTIVSSTIVVTVGF